MAEPEEAAQLLDQAERESTAGDHAAAELLLRQALKLQEASLGAVHPEVANTLNNLGVVCDTLGRPHEAEFLYRRALGIARKTLPPEHPYIATSLENLSSLYRAQGKPEKLVDVTREQPQRSGLPGLQSGIDNFVTEAEVEVEADGVDEAVVQAEAAPPAVVIDTPTSRSELDQATSPVGWLTEWPALLAGAAVVILFVVWLMSGGQGDTRGELPAAMVETRPAEEPVVASLGEEVSSPISPDPAGPDPQPISVVSDETETAAAPPPPLLAAEPVDRPADRRASDVGPSWAVADARLCSRLVTRDSGGAALANWECDPVAGLTPPGQLFYYTRVRSRTAATIEHRWFRDGRQAHQIALSIRANDGPGYRTYSARTVSPREVGPWRVELWSADGELLHVAEFVVE